MLRLMAKFPAMSENIITVCAARRLRWVGTGTGALILIGARVDRGVHRIKVSAAQSRSPFRSLPLGSPEGLAMEKTCEIAPTRPAVTLGKRTVIDEPTHWRVAQAPQTCASNSA